MTSKQYIKDCIHNCSNEISYTTIDGPQTEYREWLTPEQALKAVEIEREHLIKKACDWIKSNVTFENPRNRKEEYVVNLNRFREYLDK